MEVEGLIDCYHLFQKKQKICIPHIEPFHVNSDIQSQIVPLHIALSSTHVSGCVVHGSVTRVPSSNIKQLL